MNREQVLLLKGRIFSLFWTVFAALIIKFTWNQVMSLLNIDDNNINLIEAAILWAISV